VGKIYFQKGALIFRESILADVESLAPNLREPDRLEIWASHHADPYKALKDSFENSSTSISMVLDDQIISMFGIAPESLVSDRATIWLLGSPAVQKIRFTFFRQSKPFIQRFLEEYPVLENWVDNRYIESIQWLQWCGADMYQPEPYGMDHMLFRYFRFRRD
jgi:hypothetical protein